MSKAFFYQDLRRERGAGGGEWGHIVGMNRQKYPGSDRVKLWF